MSPQINIFKMENLTSTFDVDQAVFKQQLNSMVQGFINVTTNEISTKGTVIDQINPSIDVDSDLLRLQVD